MYEHRVRKIIDRTFDTDAFPWKISQTEKLLVILTMCAETNLGWDAFKPSVAGMMNLRFEDMQTVVCSYIRPREEIYKAVKEKTGIDTMMDLDLLYEAIEYNVAFQAWLIYLWYLQFSKKPTTIEDAIALYKTKWNGLNREKEDEYLGGLIATFMKNSRKSAE